jgi:hypothetical protein
LWASAHRGSNGSRSRLASAAGPLTFISTTTVFGTPVDVTLSELALETFFPADPATADVLRTLAAGRA